MSRRARSIWETLTEESMEGPTVTFTLPREIAQELVGVLMGALEMDGGGEGEHMEPDEDDMGGTPDGDADDADPLASLMGDGGDDGPVPDLDLDEPDDDSDDDSDDDEPDEAMDYRHSGGDRSGMRPGTALGERRRARR